MTLTKIPLKTGTNQLGAPSSLTQWGGVVTDIPAPGGLAAFDDMVNFLCRKGRSRPREPKRVEGKHSYITRSHWGVWQTAAGVALPTALNEHTDQILSTPAA